MWQVSEAIESVTVYRNRDDWLSSDLRHVLDTIPAAVFVAEDVDCKFIFGNAAAEVMLRASQASNLSKSAPDADSARNFEFFDRGGLPIAARDLPVQRAARGEVIVGTQFELRFSDGERIWLFGNASPLRNENGDVWGAVAAFTDISDQKRLERQLVSEIAERERAEAATRKSEERFRALLTASLDVVYRMSPDWSEMYQLLGKGFIANTERPNRNWLEEYIHPNDQPRVLAAINEAVRTKSTFTLEHKVLRADGSIGWAFSRAIPLRDTNGEIVEWIGAADDVTERARLFAELFRYKAIVDNSDDAIIGKSLDGIITSWNNAAEQMFGYKACEAIGQSVTILFPQDLLHEEPIILGKIARKERVHNYDTVRVGKDGSKIEVSLSVSPILDDSGNVIGAAKILRDNTERKRTEIDLRVAAIALESQEGTVISDSAGNILRVNQAFARITGYTSEEAVGQKTNLLKSGRHDAAFFTAMWKSIIQTGSWTGEIWNLRKNGELYLGWLKIAAVKGGDENVTHYVGTFSDITQRKEAEDQIKQLAFYDPLTNLPNRRLMTDRLNQAVAASARNQRGGAMLFIDLDNFKTVNDTQGHDAGDQLLQEVARRLTASFREADTVARIGGDEFVVLLADLSENPGEAAAQAESVGEKILTILRARYEISGREFRCTPSIGVTLFGDQRVRLDELMKQADIAMYHAKAAGRNTVRFFDPDLQAAINARAAVEADLRIGIQEGQFLLYYQPQVDGQGDLIGAEALVRWQHPQRGLVSPGEFIPLAEETGLILPLGRWVLEAGCAQIVAWVNRPETAHLTLAVNVSAKQFFQTDFVEQVLEVINRTGVDPQKLKLELTESLLAENIEDIIEKMFALKAKGVNFSLDDFGTGYSSLSYLKRFPLDQLKIDQSFVRDVITDPNDAAIAKTIVALAKSLGLGVIAEGVETSEQKDFLASSGCHAYQGYFFSRPLPLDDFEKYAQKLK